MIYSSLFTRQALWALLAMTPFANAGQESWLTGWNERLSGEILTYHGAQPDVRNALLVRSVDEQYHIEWTTEPVPETQQGEWATFVWLFGIDANVEQHEWTLFVDDRECLSFRNPRETRLDEWRVQGRKGAELHFRPTLVDRHEDLFGYAFLRLPRSEWKPGEGLRLKVAGESANSPVWYMTSMTPVEATERLVPRSALLRGEQGNRQPLVIEVVHLGEAIQAAVRSSLGTVDSMFLEFGANRLEIHLPEVREAVEVRVSIEPVGGEARELSCTIEPVRPWRIDLVQHTHTDIGYTRPQTEILPEHLRFIDYALDYCDQTDSLPEEARFRWTCESSWAVREYLACRTPEQVERLRQRVEEGRIEVTAMLGNMSELIDEPSYVDFLRPVRALRDAGLPVSTAMQNDVNGIAWCLADWFADAGIQYLTMGLHGHRAIKPFELATSFWWESPAGNRVLAYRADHYLTGNVWGVHGGRLESTERELFRYLQEMEAKEYPFDRVAVQHSGYLTDNSPPSTAACEVIRNWNEKYVWPRLRSSLAADFPRWVEEHHGDELPIIRAAWPDWWTDGFGSAARESAAARVTQGEMTAVEGLLAMEALFGMDVPDSFVDDARRVRESLIWYGEHTFGSAESVRDPLNENSMIQWGEKGSYVWEAVKSSALLREKALGRFQNLLLKSDVPLLAVVNTLGSRRAGLAEIYIDHQILPPARPFRIVDDEGGRVAAQRIESRSDGSYWALWVPDVPAFGYRTFRIEVDSEGEPAGALAPTDQSAMENRWYRLELDRETGGLVRLFDKELGLELVDPESEWQLGQVIYETLSNRAQLEAFMLEGFERQVPTEVRLEGVEHGPLWQSVKLTAQLPCCDGPRGLSVEVCLFHEAKRIELHYGIQKRRSFDPEALYVAFPFQLPESEVVYETLGGTATPGVNLIPGSASDWQTMQSFTAVRSASAQVILSSDEIPLVQLGGINLGEFRRVARVDVPHVFSWVMNNYWTTNFRADQEGEHRWSYDLTSTGDSSNAEAARFGASNRIPLLTRVLPAGRERTPTVAVSALKIDPPELQLVSARPAWRGDGVVLLLREVNGERLEATLTFPANSAAGRLRRQNVLEDDLGPAGPVVPFPPFRHEFLHWTPSAVK